MRSLFARVFVAIAVANAIAILAVGAVFGAAFDRRREQHAFLVGDALARHGADAATALGGGGREQAAEILSRFERRTGIGISIVDANGRVVVGRVDAPDGVELVEATRGSTEPIVATFEGRTWHAVGLPGGLVAVGAPTSPRAAFGLSPPILQLVLVFLLSGIVSLLLARWLSRPLRALRAATDRLAAGPASVRVVPTMSRTADAEVAALAHDFDRMAERIEALLESRERLLRDVSHELRSPLARLSVALELARQSAGPGAAEALDRIDRESERLGELVSLILTMAKLEQTSELQRGAPVALDELVAEIRADAAFEAKGVSRDVTLAGSEPIVVRGDEEILRQAIENVIRNAIRFTPDGTSVEVSLARHEHDGGSWARLEVRDHGPGVPDAALDEIFRPFARVESARERQSGGAGLGLAITERAVRLHGGRVRARNADGGGLAVTIELPSRSSHGA